jgi:arylsulfatase A-like enzyme
VLTSDHGEEFFEHGGKTHRAQLFRESVHVPLIASWPAGLPAGRRVAGPVGIVDVVPTVCALAGVAPPRGLSGRDLSAVARGDEPNAAVDYVTELLVFPPGDGAPLRRLGLRSGASHALFSHEPGQADRWARFDLTTNPEEAGPGAPLAPGSEAALELGRRLDEARARIGRVRASALPRRGAAVPLGESEVQELSQMGYTASQGAAQGPRDQGPPGRLCLDGCVWPGQ